MPGDFRYRAFISYSHADEAWARWLHQKLERYRVPARLVGKVGAHGRPVSARIGRCFRDEAELSAASHLSQTLQQALRESQALIVICSPSSAASRWVNEEIRFFSSLGRRNHIYALIVGGEPGARDPLQHCFPPALLESDKGEAEEPLAADARSPDGKTDAFLKIASGLVGVGFDDLRRREHRRRMRLMLTAMAVSLGIAAMTTALAVVAYLARNEATQRREEADDLISFMLGDLKGQLERVGRLDVLDSTVGKASSYLGAVDHSRQSDNELAERIAALSAIADIRYARGDQKAAMLSAQRAIEFARVLRDRRPGHDSDALFTEAVHSYAEPALDADDFVTPEPLLAEALALSATLPTDGDDAQRRLLLKVAVRDSEGYRLANGPKPDLSRAIELNLENIRVTPSAFVKGGGSSAALATAMMRSEMQDGVALYHAGRFDECLDIFRRFVGQADDLRRRFPRDQPLLFILQSGLPNAVKIFGRRGDLDDAVKASRTALELGKSVVIYEPDNAAAAVQLGQTYAADAELKLKLKAWPEVRKDVDEGLGVLARWISGPSRNVTARMHAMRLRTAEADLAVARRVPKEALTALSAGLAMAADAEASTDLLLNSVLPLQWRQWFVARDADPAVAKSARATTLKLIEDLRPKVDAKRLDLAQAAADYLDGNVTRGDALYAALRQRGDPLLLQLEPLRAMACARVACVAREKL